MATDETIQQCIARVQANCEAYASGAPIVVNAYLDLPQVVKALEYVRPFVHMSPERWNELARILNGRET